MVIRNDRFCSAKNLDRSHTSRLWVRWGEAEHFLSFIAQQTWDVGPTLAYCWPTVYDVGPTLNQRWANVSCLLGGTWGPVNRSCEYYLKPGTSNSFPWTKIDHLQLPSCAAASSTEASAAAAAAQMERPPATIWEPEICWTTINGSATLCPVCLCLGDNCGE